MAKAKAPKKAAVQEAVQVPEETGAEEAATKKAARRAKGGAEQALVIVESPAKAKTINKILGKNFVVKASMGHVRDLPKKEFGITLLDPSGQVIEDEDELRRSRRKAAKEAKAEGKPKPKAAKAPKAGAKPAKKVPAAQVTFEPIYHVLSEKKKTVDELKKAAQEADAVYLACDFDREGEAIAWHVASILKIPEAKTRRVVFNEITETAIKKAFEHPTPISMDRVNAQQARRVLDRLVGYKLSPLLWKKVLTGLSAGRVQSVAVRLIAEREKEIQAFKPEEYWKIVAALDPQAADDAAAGRFEAELKKWAGETLNLPDEAAARAVEGELKAAKDWRVLEVTHEDKKDPPDAPFRTATLQQQGSIKIHFTAKKTMMLAQQLYEGVELGPEGSVGLITYMRTDSLNVAEEAIHEARDFIKNAPGLGDRYLPEKPRRYKTEAKGAQEAHEAIRPTSAHRTPDSIAGYLTPDQLKLYRLIWERFIASQMKSAIYAVTTIEVGAGRGVFRASGKVLKFDGHAKISGPKVHKEEPMLPDVKGGDPLSLAELKTTQHFTQPAPRFTEATLVKTLEKLGIGRPSTYAQIITTIQTRGYVKKEARKFFCTDIGMIVTDKLVKHFADIMETSFTSKMETELDEVEDAKRDWQDVLREFYTMFEADLERAKVEMLHVNQEAPESEYKCEKCGKPLLYKINKYGKYLACSGYPECSNTLGIDDEGKPKAKIEAKETEHVCEKCGLPMVIKTGRRGEFLACSGYPKCKNARDLDADGKPAAPRKVDTDILCERCRKNNMVVRVGRRGPFLGCGGYPRCKNTRDLTAEEMKSLELPAHFTAAIAADAGAGAAAGAGGDAATDVKCEECGKPMAKKFGRRGAFLACTGYPECKKTKPMPGAMREAPKPSGEMCDKCGKPMMIRTSRRGPFQGCSGYPECKNAKPLPAGAGVSSGAGGAAKGTASGDDEGGPGTPDE